MGNYFTLPYEKKYDTFSYENAKLHKKKNTKVFFGTVTFYTIRYVLMGLMLAFSLILIIIGGITSNYPCDPTMKVFHVVWEEVILTFGLIQLFLLSFWTVILLWLKDNDIRNFIFFFTGMLGLALNIFFIVWISILVGNTSGDCKNALFNTGATFSYLSFVIHFIILSVVSDMYNAICCPQ